MSGADRLQAMRGLRGKVALVTGAGRGIGRGIALGFAEQEAHVFVASRNPETVRAVVTEIETKGGIATGHACDVGIQGDIDRAVGACVDAFGTVDILVNNAQSFGRPSEPQVPVVATLDAYPEEAWEFVFRTGVTATYRAMKAAFPYLKKRGGKIINFGSPAAQRGTEGFSGYNANKEAIRGLSRTAAREWARHRINVNVICPMVATDATALAPRDYVDRLTAEVPMGRFGTIEECARLAMFLASPDADFITGATIMFDGGQNIFSL